MDATIKELALISLTSCLAVGLACCYEAGYFALFFAGAAAFVEGLFFEFAG